MHIYLCFNLVFKVILEIIPVDYTKDEKVLWNKTLYVVFHGVDFYSYVTYPKRIIWNIYRINSYNSDKINFNNDNDNRINIKNSKDMARNIKNIDNNIFNAHLKLKVTKEQSNKVRIWDH